MNPIITRALPEHSQFLTDITIAAKRHWNYPETWMQLWLPALTISPEYISTHETWMLVLDGNPVAYYSLGETTEGLWLDNLWVLPEFMGMGLGRQLFEHALGQSRQQGASILTIEADPNAESFYERMGARKIGEHHGEVDGQPRILPVMEVIL